MSRIDNQKNVPRTTSGGGNHFGEEETYTNIVYLVSLDISTITI